jgi:CubicO group peptidase (beta-lactamase class C family)
MNTPPEETGFGSSTNFPTSRLWIAAMVAFPAIIGGATAADAQAREARAASLAEFEGVYDYQSGASLALVAADTLMFAVIDEAKYPLRFLGNDRFLNAGGDTIPFRRGSDRQISGFVERGTFFARRTKVVDAEVVAATRAVPRPVGKDGRVLPYKYEIPAQLNDGIHTGGLTRAGLDSTDVERLVGRVVDGTYPDVHSVLVYRHGRLVVEEYFYGYDRDRLHQLRSASKSIESTLVGIAIDRKLLRNEDELVMKRLPYASYLNPDSRKDSLKLRDLLTMRSGLECDDWNPASAGNEQKVYQSNDWVKFTLDLQMVSQPGAKGSYCSGNVKVAGRIVERASGKSLPVFAQENLFRPLGIRARDLKWNYTLNASNAATFAQLYMRPRDMLKIGMLFQQKGVWNRNQVVSREWIERALAKWSTVGDQDYGYFWWHQWVNVATPEASKRIDMVLASGNGGQKIYIVPSLDLIVVMTGGNYNVNSPTTAIMAKELLPAMLSSKR